MTNVMKPKRTYKRGTLPGNVKAPEEKLSIGRPRKEPPKNAVKIIQEAAALGGSKKAVGMRLGVHPAILTRWFDEHPELQDAFDNGREQERQTLHDVLTHAAKSGNIVAAMFLLKARHSYREGDQEGNANRVAVTFNIPGAQPLDRFMVIENERD